MLSPSSVGDSATLNTVATNKPLVDDILREAHDPDLRDWELTLKVHQFRIYRRPYTRHNPYAGLSDSSNTSETPTPTGYPTQVGTPDEPATSDQSPLYEYKVVGHYHDVKAAVLDQVYTDWEYRKTWDVNMLGWQPVGPNQFHYIVKYPFPLCARDYVYELTKIRDNRDGKLSWITMGLSMANSTVNSEDGVPRKVPKVAKGRIRVKDYFQCLVVTPLPTGTGCQVYLHYYENPCEAIPDFIVNWAMKAGIPAFIKNLHDACQRYKKPV
ncbi:hypothetical protein IWQ62_003472 [Dispira parvispora]|uniref:START domain-containing protein n=1 Tax=Dispira parvispora TaxID=1520584 RepID=A0A9W8AMU2_9FUNG|nr:hypothetical protein IWQ62_003472 [Dispira parvispora]